MARLSLTRCSFALLFACASAAEAAGAQETFAISTLFTAQNVRDLLSSPEGVAKAVRWCKDHGVTRVFIESFRDGFQATREALVAARDRFKAEGFEACGCVTTTRVGKLSTGWKSIPCFTDEPTRRRLAEIFAFTASIFDLIMIDDFLFTDCACPECEKARGDLSWPRYRMDLMCAVARRDVLDAARAANPGVKIILKYPQWYDNFHSRGYDVTRQTALYDFIWVGTETRNPDSTRWGRKAQYEGYFIMRWLGGIGGAKTGGGWFDPYGTSPPTYVEQARQTVLAGAREMLLFCYGSLLEANAAKDTEALRAEIPSLLTLARWVRGKAPRGIHAIKPPSSQPASEEEYLFDYIGMLGLPLVPAHELPREAAAVLATSHLKADPRWREFVEAHLGAKRPVLATRAITDDVRRVAAKLGPTAGAVVTLGWEGDARTVMDLPAERLAAIRRPLLEPLGLRFEAPGRVALYLLGSDIVAFENFADAPAAIAFEDRSRELEVRQTLTLPPGATASLPAKGKAIEGTLPARTLVVLELASKG